MAAIDLVLKSMASDLEDWLDRWVPHYPKVQYQALISINDDLRNQVSKWRAATDRANKMQSALLDQLAEKTLELEHDNESIQELSQALQLKADQHAAVILELESLKNKIVERAQVPTMIKAKSAGEVRRLVDQQNEREFEETANAG